MKNETIVARNFLRDIKMRPKWVQQWGLDIKETEVYEFNIDKETLEELFCCNESGNYLLFDIEAVMANKESNCKKYNLNNVSLLWAGCIVNGKWDVISEDGAFLQKSLVVDDIMTWYKKFMVEFVNFVSGNNITKVIVSGEGLEYRFLQTCYKLLEDTLTDEEKYDMKKLLERIINIQNVVKESIIKGAPRHIDQSESCHISKPSYLAFCASRKVLKFLRTINPIDGLTEIAELDKRVDSKAIGELLDEMYFEGNPDIIGAEIQIVLDHCINDVKIDLELIRRYFHIAK